MRVLLRFVFSVFTLLFLTACQESQTSKPYVMNGQHVKSRTNSVAFKTKDHALNRKNKIQMAEIEANTKLEVAKLELTKAVQIAKINSETKKVVAKEATVTSIEVSKIDSTTRDKESMINLYMTLGVVVTFIIMMFIWFTHKKKSLELQAKIEKNRLRHEFAMKEKELQEKRMHKVLDLAISGQLPQELQQDFIKSISQNDTKIIELN